MPHHIYSTSTNGTVFTRYEKGPSGFPNVVKKVYIRGGSNLMNKKMVTPLGTCTTVSDEDMEFLNGNKNFQKMVAAGFMSVSEVKVNPEVAAADMELRDESSPYVPGDFPLSKGDPHLANQESDDFQDD